VRSERLLKERLDYNLVFGWFVGLNGRHHLGCTVFTKNRERSMGTLPKPSSNRAPAGPAKPALGRALHRRWNATGSVDESESYERKGAENAVPLTILAMRYGGLPRGETVERDARIDDRPDAEMARKGKGKEAKLRNGNLLVENCKGLIVNTEVLEATKRRSAMPRW
jgi:hypothetical protein